MGGRAGGNRPLSCAKAIVRRRCAWATIRVWPDMPWSETTLEILRGPSDGHDLNAVSAAFAGIAETGTLALVSGPDNPTTLNFLPDNHIVLLPREAIEADYESVFAKLRGVYGKGEAPRTLNFITGPSRSADIEQTLLLALMGLDDCISSSSAEFAATCSAAMAPRLTAC